MTDSVRVISAPTRVVDIDAEYHGGLVPWDSSNTVAANNVTYLNRLMANNYRSGNCPFVQGVSGPVMTPIAFSGKTFYFKGQLKTSLKGGLVLRGTSGGQAAMYGQGYLYDGNLAGNQTQFVWTDGGSAPTTKFLVRNQGTYCEGIHFIGRVNPTNENSATGTKPAVLIGIEGRDQPPVGKAYFRLCSFNDATIGVKFLNGYYDADGVTFNTLENHSDETTFDHCIWLKCPTYVQFVNLQSVQHKFYNCKGAGNGSTDVVVMDCQRGGIMFGEWTITEQKATLLKLRDHAPNADFTFRVVRDDAAGGTTKRLTFFEYDNSTEGGAQPYKDWTVRIWGSVGSWSGVPSMTDWTRFNGLPTEAIRNIWFWVHNFDPWSDYWTHSTNVVQHETGYSPDTASRNGSNVEISPWWRYKKDA